MNAKRVEGLLQRALEAGEVPAEAPESDRIEVSALLRVATTVRSVASQVDAEATATKPTARARFERYVVAQQAADHAFAGAGGLRQRGLLARFVGVGARMAAVRAVAGVAAAAAVALLLFQVLPSDTGTASAQVLIPGDYVQMEGTVTAQTVNNGVPRLHLVSDAGEFEIDVSSESSIVSGQVASDVSALKLGDHILVGGVVNSSGQVGARTLVVSAPVDAGTQGSSDPPFPRKPKPAPGPMEGRVVSFSLSNDLKTARVVLDDGKGGLFLARINRKSAETLLQYSVNALGARVRLVGGSAGLFALAVPGDQPPQAATAASTTTPAVTPSASGTQRASGAPVGAPAKPAAAFVEVKGVILGREASVLRVQTEQGPVLVAIRSDTRILPGDSGATRDGLVKGGYNAVGYTLSVAGGFDAKSDRISADLIVIGPKAAK